MTPSVNLLPAECLHEWARARRRQTWIVAAGAAAFLALGAFLVRLPSGQAVRQLTSRVDQTEHTREALTAGLQTATAQQAELTARLRLIVGLEQRQPWPERLATLARLVPDGVVLTLLSAEPSMARPSATPVAPSSGSAGALPAVRPGGANGAPAAASNGAAATRPTPVEPSPAMQIKGLAASQDELMTLLERLERSGLWPRVELVIASRQVQGPATVADADLQHRTFRADRTNVVAFEIRCYTPEETP
jgi:Tfp pilus assembly protein PilN